MGYLTLLPSSSWQNLLQPPTSCPTSPLPTLHSSSHNGLLFTLFASLPLGVGLSLGPRPSGYVFVYRRFVSRLSAPQNLLRSLVARKMNTKLMSSPGHIPPRSFPNLSLCLPSEPARTWATLPATPNIHHGPTNGTVSHSPGFPPRSSQHNAGRGAF